MPRSKSKNMDPLEIECRFSNEKGFFLEEDVKISYEDFKPFIDRLPEREIDLIHMYYNASKKQKEIAEFFGVTQGAISHRLSRAKKRLRFLRDMPKVNCDMHDLLKDCFDDFEIDLMSFMVETTCQSRTAELLNSKYGLKDNRRMTQVKVRHKFERCISRLGKLCEKRSEFAVCLKLMEYIKDNLYMIHEVVLPHFNRGYKVRLQGTY